MRKKLISIIISSLIVANSVYAHSNDKSNQLVPSSQLQVQNENLVGLTNKQMMEDYDYLWKTLHENYPFFGVAKRAGIDVQSIYKTYRYKMKGCNNDKDYLKNIRDSVRGFDYGHLAFFAWWDFYEYQEDTLEQAKIDQRKTWYYAINNPISQKNYPLFEQIFNPPKQNEDTSITAVGNLTIDEEDNNSQYANVVTKIIEKNKIAYIKVNDFNRNNIDKDKNKILSFYNEVADYENLIIDISENSGGAESYWKDLLVSPNIEKTLSTTNYMLFKNRDNNKGYIKEAFRTDEIMPISQLPAFPKINKEDLLDLDNFITEKVSISPAFSKKIFKGKIWLLVSKKVYSSSEAFAVFCKNTGFATVVGSQTGGDGIGIDPVFIVLPNSGLILRYSMMYGINPDGTNSEEFGTTPDIISLNNEIPLDTCLKEIHAKQ